MKLQGLSRAKALARAVLAGRIANGIAQAQRRTLLPCCAHVAYETEVTCPPGHGEEGETIYVNQN
jgi:hypothetical protein